MVPVALVRRTRRAIGKLGKRLHRHRSEHFLLRRGGLQGAQSVRAGATIGDQIVVADPGAIADHDQVGALQSPLQIGQHRRGKRRLMRTTRENLMAHRKTSLAGRVETDFELVLVQPSATVAAGDRVDLLVRAGERHVRKVPMDRPHIDRETRQRLRHDGGLNIEDRLADRVERATDPVIVERAGRTAVDPLDPELLGPLLHLIERLPCGRLQQMQDQKLGHRTVRQMLGVTHGAEPIDDLAHADPPTDRQRQRARRRQPPDSHTGFRSTDRSVVAHAVTIAQNLDRCLVAKL